MKRSKTQYTHKPRKSLLKRQATIAQVIKKFEQRIYGFIVGLFVLLGLMVLLGDRTTPHIVAATLHYGTNQPNNIVISFNKTMERRSVEEKFHIKPNMEGTFTWQDKNLIFTPKEFFSYQSQISVQIEAGLIDEDNKTMSSPFEKTFSLPPIRVAYVATNEAGTRKLVIQEICKDFLENQNPITTTDAFCKSEPVLGNLTIDYYAIAPDGKSVYILGQKQQTPTLWNELFRYDIEQKSLQQLTNDQRFLNKAIIISPDGNYAALSRIEVTKQGEYLSRMQFWIASTTDNKFFLWQGGKALGSSLFFSPDSAFVLYKNDNDNFEIAPLIKDLSKPVASDDILFIGNYQSVYGFHPLQPIIALTEGVATNPLSPENILQLFYGDGTKHQVPFPSGLIRDPLFTPDGKKLIITFSRVDQQFITPDSSLPSTIFHLYSFDLENNTLEQLTNDDDYSDQQPVISPDGRFVIFLRFPSIGPGSIDPEYRELLDELQGRSNEAEVWAFDLENSKLYQLPFSTTDLHIFPR